MAKAKRHVERVSTSPVEPLLKESRWQPFLEDWGRLVVPGGIAAVLAALHFAGVLGDNGLGVSIGLVVLLSMIGAFAWIVWSNEFPRWVRTLTVATATLFVAGIIIPFVATVYPGSAKFSEVVSRDKADVPLGENVGSGFFSVEVFAESMSLREASRQGGEGQYRLLVGGQEVSGRFSDTYRQVRSGRRGSQQIEQKHLTEVATVRLPEGEKVLKVSRIDPVIGPDLRVSVYRSLVPPPVSWALMVVVLVVGIFLDGRFQEQTHRWRIAPFMGMGGAFLLIFASAFERGSVTSAAVWSAILGGVVGFLGGWALSLLGRYVVGKVRTRM